MRGSGGVVASGAQTGVVKGDRGGSGRGCGDVAVGVVCYRRGYVSLWGVIGGVERVFPGETEGV
jgi:hypothetical protein